MDGDFGGTDGGTAAGAPGSVGDASVGEGPADGAGDFGGIGFGELGSFNAFGFDGLGFDSMSDSGFGFQGLADAFGIGMDSADAGFGLNSFWGDESALASLEGQPVTTMATNPNSFQALMDNPFVRGLIGLLAARGVPAAQALSSTPAKAAMSSNPPATIANSAINFGLSSLGPIGLAAAMANSAFGLSNSVTSALGNTNTPASFQGNDANMGIGSMLPGLAGLYAGYQGMRDSDKMLGGLQNLYSQDSPYAQSMRQALARRDAASGRRSQYGPREVELQAKLAQMASSQIPAMAGLQRQQMMARNAMLQQGINAYRMAGGWDGIKNALGLSGLFSSIGGNPMSSVSGIENMFPNIQVPEIPMPDFNFGPPIGG